MVAPLTRASAAATRTIRLLMVLRVGIFVSLGFNTAPVYPPRSGGAVPQGTTVNCGLAPVMAPHAHERAVDLVGRVVEGVDIHSHHVRVRHRPWQPHQRAEERLLAPVDHERA